MGKTFSPIKIHCQPIELWGDGIMRVQHVTNWSREFRNIHDNQNDQTCHPCTSRTDMNAAWEQYVIWGHQTNIMGEKKFHNNDVKMAVCEWLWMPRDQSLQWWNFYTQIKLGKIFLCPWDYVKK